MADGINVKMGVTGIGEFKTAMSKGTASVKTLDAALKNNEASFKATGDAEVYMRQKADLLRQKLAAQKTVVDNAQKALDTMAKNGVDKASTAYQTMQTRLLNAQTELTNTSTELKTLGTNASSAATDSESLNKNLDSVAKHKDFEAVISGIGRVTDAMEAAAKKAWNLAKGLVDMETEGAAWADDLITKSVTYGMSTEELQQWEYAAKLVDTDVDAILNARDALTKTSGTDKGSGILEQLGITTDGKQSMDIFWDVITALGELGETTETEAMAQDLFGKSFRDLIPLMTAGRSKWEELASAAPVVSDENVQKLGAANDALDKMNSTLEKTKLDMLAALAPAFESLATALTDFINSEEGQKMLDDLTKFLTDGMDWILHNGDTVVGIVTALGTAFSGLKVSEGVLTFVNGAKGLKNLFSPDGASNDASAGKGILKSAGNVLKDAGVGATIAGGLPIMAASLGVVGAATLPAWFAMKKYNQQRDSEVAADVAAFSGNTDGVNALTEMFDALAAATGSGAMGWDAISGMADMIKNNPEMLALSQMFMGDRANDWANFLGGDFSDSSLLDILRSRMAEGYMPAVMSDAQYQAGASIDMTALTNAVAKGASSGQVTVAVNIDGETIYKNIMQRGNTWVNTRGFYGY